MTVAEVRAENLAEWDEYQGEFEAIDAVEIRPRVSGYLVRVPFVEGKEVRKGDVLFEIDPEPYQATLDERRADLARTRARLALVERDAERGERLVKAQAISQEEMDTRLTLVTESRAAVLAGEAAVRTAELDLAWTKVRAPVDGRTGRAEVTEGNLVTAGPTEATLLTTIVSLDPIYVYFEGDESAYLRYAHLDQHRGAAQQPQGGATRCRSASPTRTGFPTAGRMDFVDNQLDRETGTIRARAIVANKDRLFTPGMFARVRLIGSGVRRGDADPRGRRSAPIRTGSSSSCSTPTARSSTGRVTLGRQVDGQRRIIREGLKPGEKVVVNGLARIRPGIQGQGHAARSPTRPDGAAATPADSGTRAVNISRFFIDRPIFASGAVDRHHRRGPPRDARSCRSASTPRSCRRRSMVRAVFPGANPETIAETVATPLEEQINGVENMLYMSSQATTDGVHAADGDLRASAPTWTWPRCRCRTGSTRRCRGCRRRCAGWASPRSRARPT